MSPGACAGKLQTAILKMRMVWAIRRHTKVLGYAAVLGWMTCCSTYDAALLSEAEGGRRVGGGSGGLATGGADDPGDGDGDEPSGGEPGSGGDGGEGPSGGTPNGGTEGSGGDPASGGDGSGGGCSMEDCCPDDPDKDEPGECGCGEPDDDTDGDLTADCNDLCPNEPTKTEPGDCGCGVPAADEQRCSTIKNGIIHRYSFDGSGTEATDSVSEQHGTIENGGVLSDGVLTLDGTDQYVSLPAGIISSLTNATFEFWFTWNGGTDYQRLMDFGDTTTGSPVEGLSYLYLAASRPGEGPGSGFSLGGNAAEVETEATAVISTGVQYHIALVADEDAGAFNLFIDGAFQSGIAFTSSLSHVNDINAYLGRSLFELDDDLNGLIDEFRIYDVALSSSQIAYSHAQGPNPDIFD